MPGCATVADSNCSASPADSSITPHATARLPLQETNSGLVAVLSGAGMNVLVPVAWDDRVPVPDAALFRTSGRGMGRPNAGPGQDYWRPVAYGIDTEADGRKAVQELAAKKVDWIKIWVDDMHGTVPNKMNPVIYKAVIEEAHANHLRVAAHIFYLDDAQRLVNDGLAIRSDGNGADN